MFLANPLSSFGLKIDHGASLGMTNYVFLNSLFKGIITCYAKFLEHRLVRISFDFCVYGFRAYFFYIGIYFMKFTSNAMYLLFSLWQMATDASGFCLLAP